MDYLLIISGASLLVCILTWYISYLAGKGWYRAKLEYQQQHMKWFNKELDNG